MELVSRAVALRQTPVQYEFRIVGTLGETLSLMLDAVLGTVGEALPVHDDIVSLAAFLDAAVELTKRPFGTFHRYAAIGGCALAFDAAIGAFGDAEGMVPVR